MLPDEQRPGGTRDSITPALLLAFCRRIIQNTVSTDALLLAAYAALADIGAPKGDAHALLRAIAMEHEKNSIWPKGF